MNNGEQDKGSLLQFIYYVAIGISTNAFGYVIFLLMMYFGLGPKLAATLLYLFCVSISFYSNWKLTFNGSGTFSKVSSRFLVTHLAGYFINFCLLLIFVDYLGYSQYSIEAIAIIIVAGFIFIAFKLFVFADQGNDSR